MTSPFFAKAVGSTADRKPLDLDQVRQALALFADPTAGICFASKPNWRYKAAPGNDVEVIMAAVKAINEGDSIYFGINPCAAHFTPSPGFKASDAVRRIQFFIDVDRAKTKEDLPLSATEAEKEACRVVVNAVYDYLGAEGWPAPVRTDSGNGFGSFYRVDLPHDALSQVLLKKAIRSLADRFDTNAVKIDRGVHSAKQLAKLPGSWACKGPDTPERPHRPCRLLYVPETVQVVPVELIQRLAGTRPASVTPEAPPGPWSAQATGGGATAYARAALERECGRMACTKPGELNQQLNKSGFALGQLVGGGLLREEEVFSALIAAGKGAGCNDEAKDTDTLRRAIAAGKAEPRGVPEKAATPATPPPVSASERVPASERITYRASTVTPRKVNWIWPGRLPLGKLVTFAGQGGIGKTFVLCDITARITSGLEWPCAAGECASEGDVLFLSAEDDPDDTLVPRLIECGADLNRVSFLKNAVQDYFTLQDLTTLDRALSEMHDVRFVVLDPPTSFLGGVDDHKNAELRALLSPLSSWAIRHRLCVVFNTHFNKSAGAGADAAMRVMGSVAWVNTVRVSHCFARDPDDDEKALFIPMKVNITRKRKGLAYRILPLADERAKVEWLGEVETTANEAVNQSKGPKKRRVNAAEWLAALFADVNELPSKTIFRRKTDETLGVSDDVLREIKDTMGIKAKQKTDGEGGQAWFWVWLPEAKRRWHEKQKATAGNGHEESEN